MKITIHKKIEKSFDGEDGEKREYYWYTGVRLDTGLAIRFGSTDGEHGEKETYDLLIEEYEQSNGRKGFKEII